MEEESQQNLDKEKMIEFIGAVSMAFDCNILFYCVVDEGLSLYRLG